MLKERYIKEKPGDWTLYLRKEYRDDLIAAGTADPKELHAKGEKPSSSVGRKAVAFVPFQDGRMAVREYRHGGLLKFFARGLFLSKKRPLTELRVLDHAYQSGLNVPEPLGIAVRRAGPFSRAFLYSRVIEEGRDFVEYLSGEKPPLRREWRVVLNVTAQEVRKMHDAGIIHGDLHVKNLLMRPAESDEKEPEVFIIDFDKSQTVDFIPLTRREQNLMRLGRSVDKIPQPRRVTRSDMLRLFRAYLAAGPELIVDEKALAKKFAAHRALHAKTRKLPGQKEKL